MKMYTSFRRATLLFAVVLVAATGSVFAQEFRGSITGTVGDPNGAPVAGATVTVRNTGTNITATVSTNESGSYSVPFLAPGIYNVSATGSGFKTSSRETVQINVDDRLTIDFSLEIGTSAEVNIVADNELLDRGTVTVGTSVSQRQIEELPLAEGAPYTLATQAPGIVYTGDPNFQGPTANGNLAGFRTNGAGGNLINLDGSPNLAYDGQVAFTPPSEATSQFKVQTNSFDAQSGFTAGSTVNVALKSGTNKFHGAAYVYDRDKSRTANNFFNNRSGRERPARKYNRYGVTVNGPIFKDRTFFLFAYERQNDNVAQPTTYSVPTLLMRQGNFSELSYPIYDPNTAFLGTGANGCASGVVCRTPFLGNVIPAGRIYAPALAFMQYFPEPNLPGTTNNYITDQNLQRPYRSYIAKIDHNFNERNKLSGNWYHSRNTEDRYNLTMEEGSIFQGFENRRNMGTNANFTSTLSDTIVFDLRGSLAQFKLRRFQDGQPTAADLGFTGTPADRQGNVFPRFNFQNYLTVGSLRADYGEGRERPFRVFTLQPTLTQVWGNHTLKYGYDFRTMNEKFFTGGNAAGQYSFNGAFTMQASTSGATEQNRAGRDIAAFLLGVPASGSIDNPTEYEVSSMYQGFFVHDDFRLTQSITLNLGLRYDIETGYKEKEGRMIVGFDPTAASPIAAQVLANYNANVPAGVPIDAFRDLRGGLIFASDPDARNQKADTNNWQPRVGMSWAIDNKTVLRAGFGIFTAPFQLVTQNVVFQPGFSSPTNLTQSSNGIAPLTTLLNPFPSGIRPSPGTAQGLLTFTGRDITGTNAQGPTTYIPSNERQNASYTRFVLGFQRELWGGIGFETSYIYSKGSDLLVLRDINAVPRQYLNNLAGVTDATTITTAITNVNTFLNLNLPTNTNPFRGLIPDGGTWNSTRILRERLLTPFPQFGYLTTSEYNGKSEYQSLQLQLVKRFTKGLSVNGSYTFSREHESTRYLNPQDEELTEMVSPTERPHRFTFSGIYELPVGKGRSFGNDWHPVVDAVLGGWQMQGVYEWQSGEPLLFGNVFYNGDPSKLRNLLGKKDSEGRRYGIDIPGWDLSGFYLNGVQGTANNNVPAFGNNFQANGTNTLRYFPLTLGNFRNQRFLKFDVGLSKNFRIREGMKLQVRVEAINLLNQPYFNSPNTDPANSAFGLSNGQRQPPRDVQIGGRFTF